MNALACARAWPGVAVLALIVSVPGCSSREGKSRYLALARMGIACRAPAGWKVFDPPIEADKASYPRGRSWTWTIDDLCRKDACAEFVAPGGTMVKVVCAKNWEPQNGTTMSFGDRKAGSFGDLVQKNLNYLEQHPLAKDIERSTLKLGNGAELSYVKIRMMPGLLAGEETIHGFAGGAVGGTLLLIDVGSHPMDYNPDDVKTLAGALRPE